MLLVKGGVGTNNFCKSILVVRELCLSISVVYAAPSFKLVGKKSELLLLEYDTLFPTLLIVAPKFYVPFFPPRIMPGLEYNTETSVIPATPALVSEPGIGKPPVKFEYANLPLIPILKRSVNLKA